MGWWIAALAGCVDDAGGPAAPAPNVLLVVLDDVGVDRFALWNPLGGPLGADPAAYPATPALDALAARGVRFDAAYAMPECSPARATLLTGRYPWRHGVGSALTFDDPGGLPDDELLLPELLADHAPEAWTTGWFGKWHLATFETGPWDAPVRQGFDHYAGSLGNLYLRYTSEAVPQDYFRWEKDTDGELAWTDAYATTDTVDDAIAAVTDWPSPWLVGVGLNAAHDPFHNPPDGLTSGVARGETGPLQKYHAMIESADHELGRLLDQVDDDTVVIVIGDNGPPAGMVVGDEDPLLAKGTVGELGLRVPLVIAGPGAAEGAVYPGLVSIADLFATVAALADAEIPEALGAELDAVDLGPALRDPTGPAVRDTVFAETFSPSGPPPHADGHQQMVRDLRFKLIHTTTEGDHLYDLGDRPAEGEDLLASPLAPEAAAAYDRLTAALPDDAR
ncbi:MAG: sulfatase-like hydrolase/transferase [Myxococcota bacterium]